MIAFQCQTCRTPLSVKDEQAGQLVRCPTCKGTMYAPAKENVEASPTGGTGRPPVWPVNMGAGGGKRYGFNCGYCSSRLEATEIMAAKEGQCPTCGSNIVIPILDRYGRLIDPITKEIIKQDPHPVHAYAAAGDRAPKIIRQKDGSQTIQCPRCGTFSPITSNNCRSCGMPFTMEGTTAEGAGSGNGFCTASLVLGIIGIPGCFIVVPGVLAIVFGIIGYQQVSKAGSTSGGKGMAIAGMICGGIGLLIGAMMYLK